MAGKSKKERLAALTEAVLQAAAGNYSLKLELSAKNDEVDKLAAALNALLKKAFPQQDSEKDKDADSGKSELDYQNILDSMEESYFEVDLKGNLLFFNEATIRDLGYSLTELKGVNYREFVDEENARKVWEKFNSVYLTGETIKGFDWEIRKKDGGVIPVEASVSLLRNKQGDPIGFKGVTRDITLRKRAEEELRRNEERYRTILDTMEEGYIEEDLLGNVTFANDAACRLIGYTREEAIGLNYTRCTTWQTAKQMYEAYHRVYKTGAPAFGLDFNVIRKDGSVIELQQNVALLTDKTGEPIGFRVLFRDVTKQKEAERALRQSEEKYRNILETMEETYLETDLKGNFIFFNDALCRVYGYARHELQNMNYRYLAPPESLKKIFEDFNEIYRTGKAKTFLNHAILTKDGSIKYLEMTIALSRDAQGEPIGFHGIARDVTDRIRAERAIRESESRLRAIANNTRDVIWTMDFQFRLTYLSSSVQRVFGFTVEEIMKIPVQAMLPPDIYAFHQNLLAEELAKAQRGEPPGRNVFELQLLHKNGTPVWVEISADFNRDEKGQPFEIIGVTRDITERKRTEKLLAENEKRYRLIVENMQDLVWTMDFNMRYTFASPSFPQLTGYTLEEINQVHFSKLMTAESAALVEKIIAQDFEEADLWRPKNPAVSRVVEIELIRKDGRHIWIELKASFQRDDEGNPIGLIGVARDVTDRKKAEKLLEESEKHYRLIVENVSDIILTIDFNFNLIFISNPTRLIAGYTFDEIKRSPLDKLLAPESYQLVMNTFSEIMKRLETGLPVEGHIPKVMEFKVLHKNGSTIWVEVHGSLIRDESGRPVEILLTGRDITARKMAELALEESEKRYRLIVENMSDTITVADLNMNYIYQSPSEIRVTGYTAEEIMKIPVEKQVTPESLALMTNILAEELELESSGRPFDPNRSRIFQVESYRKDGSTIWLEMRSSFNRDENGKPVSILLAGRDITERKKAEKEKERLEKQLQQAQKLEMIGRLAGGIAHDFNNMLNVILGYCELTRLRLPPESNVISNILEIEKAASRSRDLTAQLLAFSRQQVISPQVVNLNKLIDQTLNTISRLIGEDIALKFHPDQNVHLVKFDPAQFEQILLNLAVNARDAMPNGGMFTIETANTYIDKQYCREHPEFDRGNYVLVTISDNGAGIDQETLPHIFDPFFTTKEVGKGTGLGLATVYGLVKQHDGFINVYSEPQRGTTFKIYLPANQTAEETAAQFSSPEVTKGEGIILLVEDDEMLRAVITEMLQTIGYSVIAAADPREALPFCENAQQRIDLLITDVIMPGMNGRELRDRCKTLRPDIKVLFISGYTSNVIVHHGVLEEGVHFIQKPFNLGSLSNKIVEIMKNEKMPTPPD